MSNGEQRWRIVDATGAVHEVVVTHHPGSITRVEQWSAIDRRRGLTFHEYAPVSVVRGVTRHLDVRELCAPGEMTRAEAVAAARASALRQASRAVAALPLPGDAMPEHATLPAPVCPAPTGAP